MASVFRTLNPFDEPFQPEIAGGTLIFPLDEEGWYLPEAHLVRLRQAAAEAGDRSAIFSYVEQLDPPLDGPAAWLVPLSELKLPVLRQIHAAPLHYALCSPTGKWGVLVSHEEFAVAGGSSSFIGTLAPLNERLASAREFLLHRVAWFEQYQLEDVSFADRLVRHLYGEDVGLGLIEETSFTERTQRSA